MTPPESKNSTNTNRVRCFSKDALVQSVIDEKWDLIKIICTQPFNKHVQYGLSFIKIYVATSETKEEKKSLIPQQFVTTSSFQSSSSSFDKFKNFGVFKLREDSPDSESENGTILFQRWKQSKKFENDPKISSKFFKIYLLIFYKFSNKIF